MRESAFEYLNPFIIGSMVDDAKNMRTNKGELPDLLTSADKIKRFDKAFKNMLTPQERRNYILGQELTLQEITAAVTGTTLN